MDFHAILMTIIAFSAIVAVFGKAVSLMLGPVQKDIEHLKGGQAKLESGQAKLESGQAKLEAGQAKLEARLDRVEGLLRELLDSLQPRKGGSSG